MSRLRALLNSFRTRVTIVLLLSMFFVLAMSNFFIYKFSLEAQFNQLRERLMIIAQTASLMVDADTLSRVPLTREAIHTPYYKSVAATLRKIKEANPTLKYIYTMVPTNAPDIWQFVVDPDTSVQVAAGERATSYPGDHYDVSRCPEILKALEAPSADKKLTVDEWGVFLSGYAPLRNSKGETIAVLGVDMTAADIYLTQQTVHNRALLVLIFGILFSTALGLLISNAITDRIQKLVEATRRISCDDLDFKVDVKGHDEISELATSFNAMASSLSESKKKLQNYFYQVVQSLIRILEAKDHYTRGHSERVAEYAESIALAMGFSRERSEAVRKVAELHDIGKLVIQEGILNKKGMLTDEEWKAIQEHPIIGEDALRPLLIDEDLLAMVRSHHERYDGAGYPDKLKGDNINILAQIISVADSYDAMTSDRAYRKALSKEKAVEELRAGSGTQFNAQIVTVFLEVLEHSEGWVEGAF